MWARDLGWERCQEEGGGWFIVSSGLGLLLLLLEHAFCVTEARL